MPFSITTYNQAPLAQLDRASVYGTEGCRFEPCGVYFFPACLRETLVSARTAAG
jgi:hypothetical protein